MQLTSALLVAAVLAGADDKEEPLKPLFVTVDLHRNEPQEVRLPGVDTSAFTARVNPFGVRNPRSRRGRNRDLRSGRSRPA